MTALKRILCWLGRHDLPHKDTWAIGNEYPCTCKRCGKTCVLIGYDSSIGYCVDWIERTQHDDR